METISIALLCTLAGAVISFATFQRNKSNDLKSESREGAETKAKLDYIATAVDEIRFDNKSRDREVQDIRERLVILEASTKSAHKRIDEHETDHKAERKIK